MRQFDPEVWGFLSCQDRGIMCLPDAHPYLVDILMISSSSSFFVVWLAHTTLSFLFIFCSLAGSFDIFFFILNWILLFVTNTFDLPLFSNQDILCYGFEAVIYQVW